MNPNKNPKKTTPNQSPIPSPTAGKSISATLNQDLLKELQNSMQNMIDAAVNKLSGQMIGINDKIEDLQNQMKENKKEMTELKQLAQQREERIEKLEERIDSIESKHRQEEEIALKMEMEKASYVIRLQNVLEETQENLKGKICEILAEPMKMEIKEIEKEIDYVNRVNSYHTKKKGLPRETHVRFIRRSTRDMVLQKTKDQKIHYKNQEIRILKDIPWKVRDKRKKYEKLKRVLQDNAINYTWIFPEGVLFTFEGSRHKINSIFKAKDFLRRNKEKLGLEDEEEDEEDDEEEEIQEDKFKGKPKNKEKREQARGGSRDPIVTRNKTKEANKDTDTKL